MCNENNKSQKLEEHILNITENINKAKDVGLNKITAILAISDENEEIQRELINWLLINEYKVGLKRDEYNILTIEW